jgi:Flp pilus assembly pilin Flp
MIMDSGLRKLLLDDAGQDLIEYALLAALIGTVSVLVWQVIAADMGSGYIGWDTHIQGLSTPPEPSGGGS